ncbi:MAG: hypothetical protein Lokiarch_39830 [Candidatus Lokiarchaeum sp. GC14_75]|nr:MAG: hypothetical protein Lokiarch_39830 [Candidatus Lokiarchaeum sp. GC14_75]
MRFIVLYQIYDAMHHKDPSRYWSVNIKDLVILSKKFHGVFQGRTISTANSEVLSQGFQMLIERGIDNYKNGIDPAKLITPQDVEQVFTILGGGTPYALADGRTAYELWQFGSSSGIQSKNSFSKRLVQFNKRIKFIVDNGFDYEKLINNLFPANGPGWISKGKSQLDDYLLMMNNPIARNMIPVYMDLSDIDLIIKLWNL